LPNFIWPPALPLFASLRLSFQTGQGRLIHSFFLFMPEILAATVFLIVRGTITHISGAPDDTGDAAIPSLQRTMQSFRSAVFNALAHFGRVSYSAYMFSLFTMDFTNRIFGFIRPSGWLSLIASSALYFMVLTLFSTVSFYAIELPFLRMRRGYSHKKVE
jgi:peptidoglycan/LPS O-acetylase OafA/YrhL